MKIKVGEIYKGVKILKITHIVDLIKVYPAIVYPTSETFYSDIWPKNQTHLIEGKILKSGEIEKWLIDSPFMKELLE